MCIICYVQMVISYSFRYLDERLGTISIQFNKNPLDNIYCICNRVVIPSNEKRNKCNHKQSPESDFAEENLLNWRESVSYQDYLFSGVDNTSSVEVGIPTTNSIHSQQDEVIQTQGSFCCNLFCYSRIFHFLRKRFRINKHTRTSRTAPSISAEENNSNMNFENTIQIDQNGFSIRNYASETTAIFSSMDGRYAPQTVIEIDQNGLRVRNSTNATALSSPTYNNHKPTNEYTDPVKSGLSKMGFNFDARPSGSKISYQRVSLSYNEARINSVPYYKKKDSINDKLEKKKFMTNCPPEIKLNPRLKKYWIYRYGLFSKYDEGIRLDEESWYSVTPEKISKHVADRCRCDVIIDGFCGAGGNTIQFAFTCERVIAIDIDPKKIELAKHNAMIYNVAHRIEFIVGDFFKLAPSLKANVVFLSPPWGGPTYTNQKTFSLDSIMEPYGGKYLYETSKLISKNIAFYLPRNVNTDEVMKLDGCGSKVEIEQNIQRNSVRAITAYFGELIYDEDEDEEYDDDGT